MKRLNLEGESFGYYTVIKFAGMDGGRTTWLCKCKCGTEKVILGTRLTSGKIKSCGCLQKEKVIQMNKKRKETGVFVGKGNPFYGKTHTKESREKIRTSHIDPNMTDEERNDRRLYPEYIEWRKAVYERDNYSCQLCGKKHCMLNAHHLENYKHNPKLRTSLNNGITLCVNCHNNFHHQFGYKTNKEQFLHFVGK